MRATKHDRFLAKAAALRDKARALYAGGMTQAKIARELDITPPRVWQILFQKPKPKAGSEKKAVTLIDHSDFSRKGAQATNTKLTAAQRSANASKAAKAKWAKAAEKKRAKAEAAQ
jgi:predicted transcriptional regulator